MPPSSPSRFALLQTLLAVTFFTAVSAVPYRVLLSSKPACVTLDVPRETKLAIKYHAPDLVGKDGNNEELDKMKEKFHKELSYSHMQDDIVLEPQDDNKSGQRPNSKNPKEYEISRKEKLQSMVKDMANNYADMVITVTKKRGRALGKFEIVEEEGLFNYETVEDGTLQICTQCIMASRNNPRRISMQIGTVTETFKYITPQQDQLEFHMSTLEGQMTVFKNEMESILTFADYAKKTEAEFHKQSLEMNAAAAWWPMVQILVLICTGFTQVNYMIQFFKKRHLI